MSSVVVQRHVVPAWEAAACDACGVVAEALAYAHGTRRTNFIPPRLLQGNGDIRRYGLRLCGVNTPCWLYARRLDSGGTAYC